MELFQHLKFFFESFWKISKKKHKNVNKQKKYKNFPTKNKIVSIFQPNNLLGNFSKHKEILQSHSTYFSQFFLKLGGNFATKQRKFW